MLISATDKKAMVTIKKDYVTRTIAALNTASDTDVEIKIGDLPAFRFSYSAQDGETDEQFYEKVLRELTKAIVRAVEYGSDWQRYSADISAVEKPMQNVPDDIIS